MNRRDFVFKTALVSSALMLSNPIFSFGKRGYISNRPKLSDRKFSSKIIEKIIKETQSKISNEKLAWMFENCFPNTLDTTVDFSMINNKPDTYVITGDIDAMWLRDSSAQVWPYVEFVKKDEELKKLIQGVINRHNRYILIDPYANAFNKNNEGSKWDTDFTEMKPELHERKWEIDSLCYTVRLAHGYWIKTSDNSFFTLEWLKAQKEIVKTFKEQQRKDGLGPYSFMRKTQKQEDTLAMWGGGNPSKACGLIVSSFRPSDDATILPFLIPSNYFAVESLKEMHKMVSEIYPSEISFLKEIDSLKNEVEVALKEYASENKQGFGEVLALEVDGFGNKLFMDDANVPSLLSLPYLGAMKKDDPLYQNTRNFILSNNNPHYYEGKAAKGIGGPHVGYNYIWPMSIIMRGLTSNNKSEIKYCLDTLVNTDAGTGFMHESFHKDDANKYTRSWFAWANTLFGEFVLKVVKDYPELVK
jgi:meiotically up-regulated gene 157 (Mug157) protein